MRDAATTTEPVATLAANNVPLPRPVAQRLLCDAVFVRVLTKAGTAPLDVGRGRRHPTTAIAPRPAPARRRLRLPRL